MYISKINKNKHIMLCKKNIQSLYKMNEVHYFFLLATST